MGASDERPLQVVLRALEADGCGLAEIIALKNLIAGVRAADPLLQRAFFVCRRGPRNLAIYMQVVERDGGVFVVGYRVEGIHRQFGSFAEAAAAAEKIGLHTSIEPKTITIGRPVGDEDDQSISL